VLFEAGIDAEVVVVRQRTDRVVFAMYESEQHIRVRTSEGIMLTVCNS
jgi:hypothetical protein